MSTSTKFVSKECKQCSQEFKTNYSSQIFCSRSCSSSYNNSVSPKRARKVYPCSDCGKPLPRPRQVRCNDCSLSSIRISVDSSTLKDLREKYSTSEYHAKIRGNSRSVYKRTGKPYQCQVCSYSTHVDICHIKDVRDFPQTATLSEVNDASNLVALCKNHHWEFDNGHLTL